MNFIGRIQSNLSVRIVGVDVLGFHIFLLISPSTRVQTARRASIVVPRRGGTHSMGAILRVFVDGCSCGCAAVLRVSSRGLLHDLSPRVLRLSDAPVGVFGKGQAKFRRRSERENQIH